MGKRIKTYGGSRNLESIIKKKKKTEGEMIATSTHWLSQVSQCNFIKITKKLVREFDEFEMIKK